MSIKATLLPKKIQQMLWTTCHFVFFAPMHWKNWFTLNIMLGWFFSYSTPKLRNVFRFIATSHPKGVIFSYKWPKIAMGFHGWLLHIYNLTLFGGISQTPIKYLGTVEAHLEVCNPPRCFQSFTIIIMLPPLGGKYNWTSNIYQSDTPQEIFAW